MLKKTVNIFMSFVFLLTTMGFTVSKHYCGNELVDFSINVEVESCCDMEGCCHNENEHFQLEEEYVNSTFTDNFQDFEIDLLFPIYFLSIAIEPNESVNSTIELADLPPPPKIQTFLSLLQTYLCWVTQIKKRASLRAIEKQSPKFGRWLQAELSPWRSSF